MSVQTLVIGFLSLSFLATVTLSCSSDSESGSSSTTDGGAGSGGGGGGGKKLGDDCSALSECGSGLNICLKVNGMTTGFCTRQCTKSEDCPESGWACNLSPYTACVPK